MNAFINIVFVASVAMLIGLPVQAAAPAFADQSQQRLADLEHSARSVKRASARIAFSFQQQPMQSFGNIELIGNSVVQVVPPFTVTPDLSTPQQIAQFEQQLAALDGQSRGWLSADAAAAREAVLIQSEYLISVIRVTHAGDRSEIAAAAARVQHSAAALQKLAHAEMKQRKHNGLLIADSQPDQSFAK